MLIFSNACYNIDHYKTYLANIMCMHQNNEKQKVLTEGENQAFVAVTIIYLFHQITFHCFSGVKLDDRFAPF